MPTSNNTTSTFPPTLDNLDDRAKRAARARARRAAAGATPRSESSTAAFRLMGLNASTIRSRRRRHRLKAEQVAEVQRLSYPCLDDATASVPTEAVHRETCPPPLGDGGDGVSCRKPNSASDATPFVPVDQATIHAWLVANAQAARDAFADLDPVFRRLRENGE